MYFSIAAKKYNFINILINFKFINIKKQKDIKIKCWKLGEEYIDKVEKVEFW